MTAELDARLEQALQAASAAPDDEGLWDDLEELAEALQRPDEVARLYREVLARPLAPEAAARLGRRAVGFHEEWLGEDSPHLVETLSRVLALDPTADWALQRATVVLTVRARWDDLLALYDRALTVATDDWRRATLLEEAAQLAKDFAGQPDRAIDYQKRLLALRPGDAQLASSLERLLERQQRWAELVELWRKRLADGDPDGPSLRARIAATFLDHLGDAASALAEARALLDAEPSSERALGLLERLLALASAPAEVRRTALGLLRERYEQAGRVADVERILGTALAFATRQEALAIHRELGERLAERDERAAMGHFASLLVLDPDATDAEQRLRKLAAATGEHERHADALVAAAAAAYDPARRMALLLEAGDVRGAALADRDGAEPLYRRVLDSPDATEASRRTAARRLVALLDTPERAGDRLAILDRLAELEGDPSEKRRVLGQAARLAEQIGDAERALDAWQRRLALDPQDLEALDARIDLLERQARWLPLLETLRMRASGPVPAPLRRADLVRMATVRERELGDRDGAIAIWQEIVEAFGEDVETVDALSRLFAAQQRWDDLAQMLERAVARDEARAADIVVRLADVRRERLGDWTRAAEGYHQAIKLDPRHPGARAGLAALMEHPGAKAAAVEGLAEAALRTDDHETLLALLEHRLAAAPGDRARVKLLREAAELEERRRGDAAAALDAIRRALSTMPDDEGLETELLRLAAAANRFEDAVSALRDVTASLGHDPGRQAQLRRRAAVLCEQQLGDPKAALDEALAAFAIEPHDLTTAREVVRLAAALGAWGSVARALVRSAQARRQLDPGLLEQAEAAADEAAAWDALAASAAAEMDELQAELAASGERRLGELGRAIETRIAVWHRDRRGDLAAAEAAFARALAHEPGDTETLRELARLQWRQPSAALVDTLLALAERLEDDLDALYDAAKIALDPVGDVPRARRILQRLFREATRLWERGQRTRGERPADRTALWALEQLVRIEIEADHVAEAIDLLQQGARLPVAPDESRAMRRRAADLARERLGDEARAMRLYQSIVEESLDAETVDRLARMYEARGRIVELLALRQRELEGTLGDERRLAVRLEVARLLGALEDRGGRIDALRANLAEVPGHDASIDELAQVLQAKGRNAELAELLASQARAVEQVQARKAARLWEMVARLSDGPLADPDRAIAAYRRVVSIEPSADALDALARLSSSRGDPASAADWLEKRLELSRGPERAPIALRLAEARLAAGRTDRAIHALERALAEDPGAQEVRDRLAELYRRTESWEPLARLLADGIARVGDEAVQLAYVREAAEIYRTQLDRPDLAVPILEHGLRLAPQDPQLRSALAAGLRVAGRLDEARALLEKLVAEFGRRRSPERAAVHYQLAQVAHAAGRLEEALEQLDKASSMDLGHAGILRMQGDLAREAGQLDRAERAYRALLLLVRRQASEGHDVSVGVAEVLFVLSELARARGQTAQAQELLESAFEAAAQNALEAERFTRTLIARGQTELALRTVQMRLGAQTDAAGRARTHADRAEILDRLLGRPEEALEARLEALRLTPSRATAEAARALAVRVGRVPRYADEVRAIVERLRRKEDSDVASDLLMGLAETLERDLGDLEQAAAMYRRVEDLGARTLDAWRALARVAAARGDHVEEIRALRRLVAAGVDTSSLGGRESIPEEAQTEALYRIAEVELAQRESLESGLETLAEALARKPDHARAARMLHAAWRTAGSHEGLLALWERAARGSGDPALLLDHLEVAVAGQGASLDLVREGVELAARLGAPERAERLLVRGVELARASVDGLAGQLWVPIALSERRLEAGDVAGAIEWRTRAAEAADAAGDPDRARGLWVEVAELALRSDEHLRLASDVLRRLLDAEPRDRALWGRLAQAHARLGDRAGFEDAVASMLDALLDPADRCELRMTHAAFLLDVAHAEADAVAVLRAVLDDEPDHLAAAQRLEEIFERSGRHEELADLLQRRFDRARDRQDVAAIAALALRMGGLLEASRPDDAKDLYRQGLEWAPEDPRLLRALLALYGEDEGPYERAALAERLLAVSEGEAAAALALELADLYALLEDADGVGRVLDLGFRACPGNATLRDRLEAWHRDRGDRHAIADLIAHDAAHRTDRAEAVARFREAGRIYAEELDRAEDAAAVLRKARELAPRDLDVLAELVAALVACARPDEAAAEVGLALEAHPEPTPERAHLLRVRASLRARSGEHDLAVADLEQAYAIDPEGSRAELVDALDRRRGEVEGEQARALTLRLADVLAEGGDASRSRDVLAAWADREPSDGEVLHRLRAMDSAAERWEDVVQHCARLVEVERAEAQLDAALGLAEAARRAGRPEAARPGLERAYRDQPDDPRVRDALRATYEASHAWPELVDILLADAARASEPEARFDALRRAGELLVYEVQDPARAIDLLREALALREDDADTVVVLADAMIGAGALAEAVELLQHAIGSSRRKRSPALAMMQLRMARIAGLSGDQQTQLEWLKVALESDKTNGTIAAELADLAMALHDDQTAMNALKVVTLQKTPGPMSKAVAFLRQAQIAHRAGDHQKAVLWARRARIEDSELHEAEEFLRSLGEV